MTLVPPFAFAPAPADLAQLVPVGLLCASYARRVRTLAARREDRVPRGRQACFYGGCLAIVVALVPLGGVGGELLFAHTARLLLLGDVAGLLLVLGLTGPLLAPVMRVGVFYRLRVLAHPLIALPLWAGNVAVWQLPGAHQAALEHAPAQVLQHALFLFCGANMWICLFGPLPAPAWFGSLAQLLYILVGRLCAAALGNVLLWSDVVFYPYYLPADAAHHLSPIADQNLAGAVVLVEGALLTVGLFWWLFLRTAREARERLELLELARLHGLPLSERRAARAVSSGRGAELRRRLEVRARGGEAVVELFEGG